MIIIKIIYITSYNYLTRIRWDDYSLRLISVGIIKVFSVKPRYVEIEVQSRASHSDSQGDGE